MSRYIDTKWLEDNAKEYSLGYYDYDEYAVPLSAVEDAPTIDIVHCGECKHRKPSGYIGSIKTYECDITGFRMHDLTNHFCSYGSSSENPNNCEHITEDGVTCARYPACDDCIDNPLNKVKGSERLVKGSERSSE